MSQTEKCYHKRVPLEIKWEIESYLDLSSINSVIGTSHALSKVDPEWQRNRRARIETLVLSPVDCQLWNQQDGYNTMLDCDWISGEDLKKTNDAVAGARTIRTIEYKTAFSHPVWVVGNVPDCPRGSFPALSRMTLAWAPAETTESARKGSAVHSDDQAQSFFVVWRAAQFAKHMTARDAGSSTSPPTDSTTSTVIIDAPTWPYWAFTQGGETQFVLDYRQKQHLADETCNTLQDIHDIGGYGPSRFAEPVHRDFGKALQIMSEYGFKRLCNADAQVTQIHVAGANATDREKISQHTSNSVNIVWTHGPCADDRTEESVRQILAHLHSFGEESESITE